MGVLSKAPSFDDLLLAFAGEPPDIPELWQAYRLSKASEGASHDTRQPYYRRGGAFVPMTRLLTAC
jgi:hypothetical protein